MRRTFVLGLLLVTGAVMTALPRLNAQQPAAAPPPGLSAPQRVNGNVYVIQGNGGNTAAFVAANGIVLVDTKLANNGQAILDQVRTISDKPITHIINTHTHGDHNGSNQFFPATVEIVTHENTQANMQKMEVFQQAANRHGLPDRVFKDRLTLLSGADAIDLHYFGAAHTNGDAFVVFKSARVLHAGDAFANKGQPNIDLANGGSGVAYPDTLRKAFTAVGKEVDNVIGGHSPVIMKPQDLSDQAEFTGLMLAQARKSLKAGQTPEQAMTDFRATLPAKFKDYNLAPGRGGAGGAFVALLEELKR